MGTRSVRRLLALATAVFCAACSGSSGATPTTSTAITSVTTTPPTSTAPTSARPSSASPTVAMAGPLTASCLGDEDRPHVVHLAPEGETLEGLSLGTGAIGIAMAHQLGDDLCEWKPYAQALAKQGYRVLIFSQGSDDRAGVIAAAGELRLEGARRIMLVGASIGGTAVLAAAAVIRPAVAAVVDLSGPAELNGMNAAKVVPRLTMPILFVAGSLDGQFVRDTKAMYKTATRSAGRRLLVVATGSHGVDLVTGKTQTTIEAFLHAHASG